MNPIIDQLKQQAIESAIQSQWEKAIDFNEKILAVDPNDIEALLRLGFALLQKGKIKEAKKNYQKALKIQPGNQIAHNYLERIKILEGKKGLKSKDIESSVLNPNLFLDLPGKTKAVSLINLGQIKTLAKLKIGQKLILKIKKRRVEARTENNEYVGALPDDISKRLIIFIKEKSNYSCFVKEVSKKNVEVFIKEEKKGKKVARYLSFPKNMSQDLKNIEEGQTENEDEIEEIDDEEAPFDLEKLAEEIEEKELYDHPSLEDPDEEENLE